MLRLKVLMIGPCESGKSTIANFLSDATENIGKEYRPTQGVRILEFESPNMNIGNKYVKTEIELWDCSGDHKFEACWPAIQRDVGAVVFVFNPEKEGHAQELDMFYSLFVEQQGIQDFQCLVMANRRSGGLRERRSARLSTSFARVPQMEASMEDGNRVRSDFNSWLMSVVSNLTDRREQEELNIMNMRS